MKQTIAKATLLLSATVALFASCSKNKSSDLIDTTVPQPLVIGISEKEDADSWSKFSYDNKRRLTEIAYMPYKALYSYNGDKAELKLYKTGSAEPYGTYKGELNTNGTLKSLTGSKKSGNGIYSSSYTCTYNDSNQLVQMIEEYKYDNGPLKIRKTDYTWQNGNCIRITLWNEGKIQNERVFEYDLTKENKIQLNGRGFMEWTDATLLGRTNKNIEKSVIWKNGDGSTNSELVFNWTFDQHHFPVQCQIKNKLTGTFYTEAYQFQ